MALSAPHPRPVSGPLPWVDAFPKCLLKWNFWSRPRLQRVLVVLAGGPWAVLPWGNVLGWVRRWPSGLPDFCLLCALELGPGPFWACFPPAPILLSPVGAVHRSPCCSTRLSSVPLFLSATSWRREFTGLG